MTELVADVDLVHEQLWIAAGEPMSARHAGRSRGERATPERHAIEVRLSRGAPGTAISRRRRDA